jgi:heat shock protein HslJ
MNPRTRPAIAIIALAGLLTACASVSPAADAPSLDGTAWVLAELPGQARIAGSTVTLRFEAGQASGTDGCNRYAVPYAASGASLRFEPSGISTQMACAPELMRQASAYLASLTGTGSYRVDGAGQLQLLAGDGALLASLAPQAQDLVGTAWHVTAYNDGKQAVVSVLGNTTLTMAFAPDGRVSGSAGCNNYTASYTSAGPSLGFGPAATTRRMCAEPGHVMEQEKQFLQALGSVASARREGGRLELRAADGALAVSLAQATAP